MIIHMEDMPSNEPILLSDSDSNQDVLARRFTEYTHARELLFSEAIHISEQIQQGVAVD